MSVIVPVELPCVVNLPVAVPANLLRDGVSAAGVGGALLGVGPLEHGFCSRCRQAHPGSPSPSPLALVREREAIPRRRPAPLRQGHLRRPA